MDRNEHLLEPCHLGVPSGAFKTISEPMVFLAQTVHLSPNWPKRDSTWPSSPSCSIRCVQNDFWAYGMFRAKSCTYIMSRLALSPNGPKRASTWASSRRSPSRAFKMISEPTVRLLKPCNHLTPILTLSLNGPKWDSTWPTSPRCSIRCVQNDIWAYGTFGVNRAPILHRY
jgi:hypothetical protein